MSEEILINVTPQETRVAITGAGVVQELLIERAASRGLVGNIYVGRVARVLPGMQSAFVEIGLERAAFLHVGDIRASGEQPIEKILAEGQPLLVQVLKDPIGTKGARLSTQVSIAGRLLVYLPACPHADPHIGISQKIERRERPRRAARARCASCCRPTRTAASSCARSPRPRPRTSCAPTSPTCGSCGAPSANARWGRSRRCFCTRTCRSRSACCATW